MNAAMGVDTTHVPYRGSAQGMQDLMAVRIDYFFCALGAAAIAPLEGKTAKAIAILARERRRRCFRTWGRAPLTSRALTNFETHLLERLSFSRRGRHQISRSGCSTRRRRH